MQGLSVNDVVDVSVTLSPPAAPARDFGALLILGASPVIDTQERIRSYSGMEGVGADFGQDAPEYKAALLFFEQSPKPSRVCIGRWAQQASSGTLHGGALSAQQQDIANFNTVTSGGLSISIDGKSHVLSGIDLSSATNLNGIASEVTAHLDGTAKVVWNSTYNRFEVISSSTGSDSSVGYAMAPTSGTDLGSLMGLDAESASSSVAGIDAESLQEAVQLFASSYGDWYGLLVAADGVDSDDHLAVAALVEGLSSSHIYGVTSQDRKILDGTVDTDLASKFKAAGYGRSFIQYSSSSPYAAASLFGRAFTVDFTANNSTITLKFKQEPGISPEILGEHQAAVLRSKNCNVLVQYNNSSAIIQEGVMSNGDFFDEVQGLDWLQNDIQTAVWSLLYGSNKIPQTDAGVNQIASAVESSCERGVNNGLIAPGVWNGPVIGALNSGQTLAKGYYVYRPALASQSQADREARKAPTLQVAVKLAGAVHFADVLVSVNR